MSIWTVSDKEAALSPILNDAFIFEQTLFINLFDHIHTKPRKKHTKPQFKHCWISLKMPFKATKDNFFKDVHFHRGKIQKENNSTNVAIYDGFYLLTKYQNEKAPDIIFSENKDSYYLRLIKKIRRKNNARPGFFIITLDGIGEKGFPFLFCFQSKNGTVKSFRIVIKSSKVDTITSDYLKALLFLPKELITDYPFILLRSVGNFLMRPIALAAMPSG